MNLRTVIELILRVTLLVTFVGFLVFSVLVRFVSTEYAVFVPVLFMIFIVDIYISFIFYIIVAKYLTKSEKSMLAGAATALIILIVIFMILAYATGIIWFTVLLIIIGLPGMIALSSVLRKKRDDSKLTGDSLI